MELALEKLPKFCKLNIPLEKLQCNYIEKQVDVIVLKNNEFNLLTLKIKFVKLLKK